MTTVFDVSNLFYDFPRRSSSAKTTVSELKWTLRYSSHLLASSRRPEDVKMLSDIV